MNPTLKHTKRAFLSLGIAVMLCIVGFLGRISAKTTPVNQNTNQIALPIFMYHFVLQDNSKRNDFVVSVDEFENDIKYLKENGYTAITMQDLVAFCKESAALPEKPVMITFDDGYECIYEYVYPILQQYDFKAVLSIIGRYTEQYSQINEHNMNYSHCTWQQLLEMQQSGFLEIGNHTYNLHAAESPHRGATIDPGEHMLSYQQRLEDDLASVQTLCGQYLNQKPITFAYPYGFTSSEALPVIKKLGFQGALTCREQINYLTGDAEELYYLGRFNRPSGKSAKSILEKT